MTHKARGNYDGGGASLSSPATVTPAHDILEDLFGVATEEEAGIVLENIEANGGGE